MINKNKKVKHYVLQELIGSGASAEVWKAIDIRTNEFVAIKIIPNKMFEKNSKMKELFENEKAVLSSLDPNNENVITFIDFIETSNNKYIILQLCDGGDFETHLKDNNYFDEYQSIEYLKQLINGFKGNFHIKNKKKKNNFFFFTINSIIFVKEKKFKYKFEINQKILNFYFKNKFKIFWKN